MSTNPTVERAATDMDRDSTTSGSGGMPKPAAAGHSTEHMPLSSSSGVMTPARPAPELFGESANVRHSERSDIHAIDGEHTVSAPKEQATSSKRKADQTAEDKNIHGQSVATSTGFFEQDRERDLTSHVVHNATQHTNQEGSLPENDKTEPSPSDKGAIKRKGNKKQKTNDINANAKIPYKEALQCLDTIKNRALKDIEDAKNDPM